MLQKNVRMRWFRSGSRVIGIAMLLATASIASYAGYNGRGELSGTVTDVRQKDERVMFWVQIDEQDTTGPRLGSPAMLVYKGERISDIKPGIKLHVKFDGDNEVTRDTDVLFVESIEFPDGRIVQGESLNPPATLWPRKWSEVFYMVAAFLLLFTGTMHFYKRLRGSANR